MIQGAGCWGLERDVAISDRQNNKNMGVEMSPNLNATLKSRLHFYKKQTIIKDKKKAQKDRLTKNRFFQLKNFHYYMLCDLN